MESRTIKLYPRSRRLVWEGEISVGNVIDVTITVPDSESFTFTEGETYRLTTKRVGRIKRTDAFYWNPTYVDSKNLSVQIDLRHDDYYDFVGNKDMVCMQWGLTALSSGTLAAQRIRESTPLYNSIQRPGDEGGTPPSRITMTDAEILARFDAISGALMDVIGLDNRETALALTSYIIAQDEGDEEAQKVALSALFSVAVNTFQFRADYEITGNEPAGMLYYNNTLRTMCLALGNGVIYNFGSELLGNFRNNTGETIPNATPVMYAGSVGASGKLRIAPYDPSLNNPDLFIGLTTEAIVDDTDGKVATFGEVHDANTTGSLYDEEWALNDVIYHHGTLPATMTNVMPEAPNYAIKIGVVSVLHANNGVLTIRPSFNCKFTDLADVDGTPLTTSGQIAVWDNDRKVFDFTFNILDHVNNIGAHAPVNVGARDLSGFEDRSALLFTDAVDELRRVRITAPEYWCNGVKYTTLGAAWNLADDGLPLFMWLDGNSARSSNTAWDVTQPYALLAMAYRYGDEIAVWDERHHHDRDRNEHQKSHLTDGARYGEGFGAQFDNTTFAIDSGVFFDEDIKHSINATTVGRLWYRRPGGASMAFSSEVTLPYYANLSWDNAGTMTPAGANKIVNSFIYATNDIDYPIYIVVGQAEHVNIAAARLEAAPTIPGITTREWKLLYIVSYSNTGGTPTIVEARDKRTADTGPGSIYVSSDHQQLVNRSAEDSHPGTAIRIDYAPVNYNGDVPNAEAHLEAIDDEFGIAYGAMSDMQDGIDANTAGIAANVTALDGKARKNGMDANYFGLSGEITPNCINAKQLHISLGGDAWFAQPINLAQGERAYIHIELNGHNFGGLPINDMLIGAFDNTGPYLLITVMCIDDQYPIFIWKTESYTSITP